MEVLLLGTSPPRCRVREAWTWTRCYGLRFRICAQNETRLGFGAASPFAMRPETLDPANAISGTGRNFPKPCSCGVTPLHDLSCKLGQVAI